MPDVTPPTPPHPKAAAKGLAGVFKNKPTWMWIAGVTTILGVAYFVWRNGQHADATAAATADGSPETAPVGPVGGVYDYSDGAGLTHAPTQGAFGGYDSPMDGIGNIADNAGNPEGPLQVINVNVPGPAPAVAPALPKPKVAPKPGGGHPPRNPGTHKAPPKKKPKPAPPHAKKPSGGKKDTGHAPPHHGAVVKKAPPPPVHHPIVYHPVVKKKKK